MSANEVQPSTTKQHQLSTSGDYFPPSHFVICFIFLSSFLSFLSFPFLLEFTHCHLVLFKKNFFWWKTKETFFFRSSYYVWISISINVQIAFPFQKLCNSFATRNEKLGKYNLTEFFSSNTYFSKHPTRQLLYILTSVWMLCTANAGRNLNL